MEYIKTMNINIDEAHHFHIIPTKPYRGMMVKKLFEDVKAGKVNEVEEFLVKCHEESQTFFD